jgi:replicative DNA helicase
MIERKDARETGRQLVDYYRMRAESPTSVWGIPWPFPSLNAITGGIQYRPRPAMTVLMAPPKCGKTAITAKIARHTAEWLRSPDGLKAGMGDKVVRCVLLEGSRLEFQDRMTHMLANTSSRRFQQGRASKEEWDRYLEAQRQIFQLPIEYMDAEDEDTSFPAISAFIKRDNACAWWCLDHIGLVPGYERGNEGMVGTTKAVTRLIRQTAPGFVLTHLQRTGQKAQAGKETPDRRPTPESVAGSFQVVKDADLLLALYRPDMFQRLPEDVARQPLRPGELIVMAQRNGPDGTIHMVYNSARTDWQENPSLNGYWLDMLKE